MSEEPKVKTNISCISNPVFEQYTDYLLKGISNDLSRELKLRILNTAKFMSEQGVLDRIHKDIFRILPADFWYSFYDKDKNFKFNNEYIMLRDALLNSPENIITKRIVYNNQTHYFTDKHLSYDIGLIKSGYLSCEIIDQSSLFFLLTDNKMPELKEFHPSKLRNKADLINELINDNLLKDIISHFGYNDLYYLNYADHYLNYLQQYWDLESIQKNNIKVMLHTIAFKLYIIRDFDQLKTNQVLKVDCIADCDSCKFCFKMRKSIIKSPFSIYDLPPFRQCNHREDCGCRCSVY